MPMTTKSRRLAVTGLPEDAVKAISAYLLILRGRTSSTWSISESEDADALLVGPDEHRPTFERWQASGKPWVAVATNGGMRLGATHAIEMPFRLFPVLGLLQELEGILDAPATSNTQARPCGPGASAHPCWIAADALRALTASTARGVWHRSGSLFVRDDAQLFATDQALIESLRLGSMRLSEFEEVVATPPAQFQSFPIEILAWHTGWHSDPESLAPWLDAKAHFRLRHWPDFGLLRGDAVQVQLAACLTVRAWSREMLVSRTGIPSDLVTRFINAAALAGILVASAAPSEAPVPKSEDLISGILAGIKRRLGWGAHAPKAMVPARDHA